MIHKSETPGFRIVRAKSVSAQLAMMAKQNKQEV